MKTNLEIIQEFYETLNPDLIDPDVDWNATDGFSVDGSDRGRKTLQQWFCELATQFDNWKDIPEQLLNIGDVIIGQGYYQGRSKVTGKTYSVTFSHIWLMKNGRIIKLNQHINTSACVSCDRSRQTV